MDKYTDKDRCDWLDKWGLVAGHAFGHRGYGYYMHFVKPEVGGGAKTAREVIDEALDDERASSD